ncbi:putative ATP-dependent RNA helicase TDRD12 [Adelges cooleyi]|uniref:putative ATP-dependent RNA helicase TDRD12 n=1 Tax=Adelges cooleyi TaxID=133065 RepID=UPI0021806D77|nr:putative ATP-dependent RNA helicase TDRD12 [Adelges cooleyi]
MTGIPLQSYPDLFYDISKNNTNTLPVYGPFEKLFISDWAHSKLHPYIAENFDRLHVRRMEPIQQNSFQYLMNKQNLSMVGFSKGKSLSYLSSTISLILYNNKEDNYTLGPKCVILSSSLGSCSVLDSLAKELVKSVPNKSIKIVHACSSISVQQTIVSILNGCDILIATPSSFQYLLNNMKLFNWSNLEHFVFDNMDLLLGNYKEQMLYFFKLLSKLKEEKPIQFVAASVKWSKHVDEYLDALFVKWQYVFGSHLEAARYMKIGFHVIPAVTDKMKKISKCLKENIEGRRCILITSSCKDHKEILHYLNKHNSDLEIYLPGDLKSAKVYVSQSWEKPLTKNKFVLICNDDMLFDFYIDSADCLIHYDMPIKKHKFSIRFSVLQVSSTNFQKKTRNTYVFLNEKNMMDLPKIVQQMKLFGNGKVNPVLETQANLISEELEKTKINLLFCPNLQQFGHCPKSELCRNRHILVKELDEPCDNIPKSGLAIIKVLNVYDASHMSVKLLKLSNTKSVEDFPFWSNVEDYSSVASSKVNCYFSSQKQQVLHENLKIGDKVAVQIETTNGFSEGIYEYFRAIILDILDNDTLNPKAKVKLIDQGCVDTVSKWRIFVLPERLKSLPTSTVDLILACVKPVDYDKTWCPQANILVKKDLQYIEDCQESLIIKIKMALGTTVWMEHLYRKYWHAKKKIYVNELVLPDLLVDKGYADKNFDHIDKLVELSNSAQMNTPSGLKKILTEDNNYEFTLNDYMSFYKLPTPQWAHLEKDVCFVSIGYVISPRQFFVCNTKFYDSLENLQKKIDSYIEQNLAEKLIHIVKGAICLARNPHLTATQYNRAMVTSILDNNYVEVLFVDHGEFLDVKRNSLRTIQPNMISDLPFQIVECSLSGINESVPDEDDLLELTNYFFQLTENPMYLKVVDNVVKAKFTDGNLYDVILYDENITVNLNFMDLFKRHCNEVQMNRVVGVIDALSSDSCQEDNNKEYNEKDKPYQFDIEKLLDSTDVEDIEAEIELLNSFGKSVLGEEYLNLTQTVSEDKKENDGLLTIREIAENDDSCSEKPTELTVDVESESDELNEKSEKACTRKTTIRSRRNAPERNQPFCLTCNTNNAESIVPKCVWYQDVSYVYLKFDILEFDSFHVESNLESITLSVRCKNGSYLFKAVLFGLIKDENVSYKRNFQGIYVKAEKMINSSYKWPHLFTCGRRHKYLTYDLDHVEANNYTAWIKSINKWKMMAIGVPLENTEDYESDLSVDDVDSYDVFEDAYD